MKYSIMTFDLRNFRGKQQAQSVRELLRWYDPDIVCIRNLEDRMLPELPFITEAYRVYGGKAAGRRSIRSCILYRKGMFELADGHTEILRTSPLRLPCVITSGTLVNDSDRLYIVCAAANRPGGQKIAGVILQNTADNMIICGDLDEIRFQQTGLIDVRGINRTVSAILRSAAPNYRPADRILISEKLSLLHAEAVESLFMGVRPSGRIPVYCELEL
ncbi:MAG: endonuclease/exonuclease/phosphatase family protein [Solobacterium sp.]|nr:endonuclease/exonuclease/phosphatase family protein [Solobacterium sp.]